MLSKNLGFFLATPAEKLDLSPRNPNLLEQRAPRKEINPDTNSGIATGISACCFHSSSRFGDSES